MQTFYQKPCKKAQLKTVERFVLGSIFVLKSSAFHSQLRKFLKNAWNKIEKKLEDQIFCKKADGGALICGKLGAAMWALIFKIQP